MWARNHIFIHPFDPLIPPARFAHLVFSSAAKAAASASCAGENAAAAASLANLKSLGGRRVPSGIVALDVSPSAVGVAVSDASLVFVKPVSVLSRRTYIDVRSLAMEVEKIAFQHDALAGVVFGWPVELDGTQGEACARVLGFAEPFVQHSTQLKLFTVWDESFSTWRAARGQMLHPTHKGIGSMLGREQSRSRKKRNKSPMDDTAAAHILNDFLRHFEENDSWKSDGTE